ncbi:hypothetical protein PESP_b0601 [Pseudoalteromonas espejiana DSM 9414]|nr:hypothetical protein PESP_b0601 [Pseudoalteromonas espejiana DSM 9414]
MLSDNWGVLETGGSPKSAVTADMLMVSMFLTVITLQVLV